MLAGDSLISDRWFDGHKSFVSFFSTVRVWDYTQDACINILSGHTAPVRGLMWNPEIPYLLISGSWDYTIRVWDTRDGTCLDTVYDHGADVYGNTLNMFYFYIKINFNQTGF